MTQGLVICIMIDKFECVLKYFYVGVFDMSDINQLLRQLKSKNSDDRYDACEQLRIWKESLPQEAIDALGIAATDSNTDVADAAKRALALHTGKGVSESTTLSARNSQEKKNVVVEKCPDCGAVLHPSLNHCTNCKKAYRPSRLKGAENYPKAEIEVIVCFAAKQDETLVFADPDNNSERLYLMGPEEVLPLENEVGDYYCLHLPGNELGYVINDSGIIVEVRVGELNSLGSVRQNYRKEKAEILSMQPNGSNAVVGVLQENERYPVIEEREDVYKILLPNQMLGWIHKAYVIRTLSSGSVLINRNS